MKVKVKANQYLFIYDKEINAALDPNYIVKNVKVRKIIAIKFEIHAWNMLASINFIRIWDYFYQLQNVYLIAEKKSEVSTPKNWKCGLDKFMIASLRTEKFKFGDNLLK